MALRGVFGMGLAVVIVSLLWARATAQSGCTSVLVRMAPCLNYVTGSSSTPSSSCCSQLASVVQSRPQCLCSALNGGGSVAALGVTINQTLALALPSACSVQTPPVSRCNAANGPAPFSVDSPVGSPEGLPGNTSTSSSGSDTGGSKAVPTNGEVTPNGGIMETPLQLILPLIFVSTIAATWEFSLGFLGA
ncbi:non-specific lipid transfer protein GPI-anchored 5-like isoform X1 [Alnus glutinosa]|uniref:non-specific lipid transfer protein GPI-anchored 5-like isoform X1 n=1 Tax=Alnus glutinosa TaxID=3517 RepID=UPI002D784919|nr:non-specific lipid transfer protein GPI-anchored 5-like isoform X1 [Alnus glutinosa]